MIPKAFQNTTSPNDMQNYAYVTIRLSTDAFNEVIAIKSIVPLGYGYLDSMASVFSAISILLIVYKLLMGDMRLNPFGWIQRWVFRSRTRKFIEKIKQGKDEEAAADDEDEWLAHVLFTLYIDGNGLEQHKDKPSLKSGLKDAIRRLKSRWADTSPQDRHDQV